MKKFTLEFADNEKFDKAKTVETQAGGKEPQTCEFLQIYYYLNDLKQDDSDVLGRGASKTFFYYVREKKESSTYPHYKFDQSVYRFKVVATDNTKGVIDCAVTYRKGCVNSEGEWINDDTTDHDLTDTSIPHLHQHLLHVFAPFWYVGRHSDVPCRRGGALRCCGLDAHSSQGECEGR